MEDRPVEGQGPRLAVKRHVFLEIEHGQLGDRHRGSGLRLRRPGRSRRRFVADLDAGDDPGRLPARLSGGERPVPADRHPPRPGRPARVCTTYTLVPDG